MVLCTATQPALGVQDGFAGGLDIPDERELAPEPRRLCLALKRVRVEVLPGPVADATIAARFAEQPQMLCIVNSRRHARVLLLCNDRSSACRNRGISPHDCARQNVRRRPGRDR